MNRTINVNLATRPYILDEEAYAWLGNYLDDVRSRLSERNPEATMEQIERRLADIFDDEIKDRYMVISLEMVRRAAAITGAPGSFGESRAYRNQTWRGSVRRLYRSRRQKVLAGVCGGLSDYFGVDAIIFRVVAILTFGVGVWVYLLLWILVPLNPYQR